MTTEATKLYRKNVHLTFPPEISGNPLVCNLTRLFDLSFNILEAQITPRKEGHLVLELVGSKENCLKALDYLKEHDVMTMPPAQRITRVEELCMHCGMCTAVCPVGALYVEQQSRHVLFNRERCTACSFCTKVCPVCAMTIEVEHSDH